MSSEITYRHSAELYTALDKLIDMRRRVAETSRPSPTAREFYASLRTRAPELPEFPLTPSGDGVSLTEDAQWPDSCVEWINVAVACYQAAFDDEAAGNPTGATFHQAEGAFATHQASLCLKLGF